jgi:hypothetical protein
MHPLHSDGAQLAIFTLIAILLICICVSAIFYFKAKHKEKLMLIEKGMTDTPIHNGNTLLKTGIIIIGLSVGLIINTIIDKFHVHDAILIAVIGICGGISMIIANRLDKKE